MENKRICLGCNLEKLISSFGKSKGVKKSYPRSYCKICAIRRLKEWRQKNPDKIQDNQTRYLENIESFKKRARKNHLKNPESNRISSLKRLYGITSDDYEMFFQKQKGLCAICLTPNSTDFRKKRFSIDHCHRTGKVRGLLCGNCNSGLGLFKDDLSILRTAVEYLRESNS